MYTVANVALNNGLLKFRTSGENASISCVNKGLLSVIVWLFVYFTSPSPALLNVTTLMPKLRNPFSINTSCHKISVLVMDKTTVKASPTSRDTVIQLAQFASGPVLSYRRRRGGGSEWRTCAIRQQTTRGGWPPPQHELPCQECYRQKATMTQSHFDIHRFYLFTVTVPTKFKDKFLKQTLSKVDLPILHRFKVLERHLHLHQGATLDRITCIWQSCCLLFLFFLKGRRCNTDWSILPLQWSKA
jgi:hypothetical protein